jgi:hypothetical protein
MIYRDLTMLVGSAAFLALTGCASTPQSSAASQVSAPQVPPPQADTPSASKSVYDCQTARSAALVNGAVNIRPGETLCLRLQTQGESIVPVAIVERATSDILVLTFIRKDRASTLIVRNPLNQRLCYKALMRVPGRSDAQPTNIWAVLSHRFGFENWPYDIDELTLSGFRSITDPQDPFVCK